MKRCNDWWVEAPIIGKVKTIPIKGLQKKGDTYSIVKIVKGPHCDFYVTNVSYEPDRKCEPVVIVDALVKKFTPKKR